MNLYVVRHGEVLSNIEKVIAGCNDEVLTEMGIAQAESVRDRLNNIEFDAVYSSPVLRAVQTAHIITGQSIFYDKRLEERNPGSMLGYKRSEINKDEWNSLDSYVTAQGSETLLAGIERVKSFLDELSRKYKDEDILIVTHNFICKCIWIIEENVMNPEEINNFFQKNDEIKVYKR